MNIDFYISSLSSGGAEHVLRNIAEWFENKGEDVRIISLEKRPQFYSVSSDIQLLKVDNTHKNKIKELISDYLDLRKIYKKNNAAVTFSFLSRCNLLLTLIACTRKREKRKLVVCDRNNPLKEHSRFSFFVSTILYSFANIVVVQTEKIKSYYPKFLQNRIVVIPNPIDTIELENQLGDKKVVKEKVIISAGRLEAQKDFVTLINAFSKSNAIVSGWKLKIFGQGNMRESLNRIVKEKGLTDYIMFCGATNTLFYEMKCSEIFILSSFYEGFPNVLCEAMYAGLPCISTDCVSGPSELIENGVNGYLVDVQDEITMSKYINILIESEELRGHIGANAEESVQKLRMEEVAKRWSGVINSVE